MVVRVRLHVRSLLDNIYTGMRGIHCSPPIPLSQFVGNEGRERDGDGVMALMMTNDLLPSFISCWILLNVNGDQYDVHETNFERVCRMVLSHV